MLILEVFVKVKPGCIEAFSKATFENASASVKEPGVARFDVLQQNDDSSKFVLMEVYRTPAAVDAHKATPHYKKWAAAVEPLQAEARTRIRFTNLFPDDQGWT